MVAKETRKRAPNPKGEPSGEGGKEQAYTPEQVEKALRESGGLITSAAAKLGCSRKTVYAYMERFPELADIRRESDEVVTDIAEANIMLAVKNKNISISQWWLNHKAKHRGYGNSVTLEGNPERPVLANVPVTITFVDGAPAED